MNSSEGVTVRVARTADDWQAVRDLCCRTGDAGSPIESSRWPFFAELWVGPYQKVLPGWTYVADVGGQVVGYLTGCPNTSSFRRSCALAVTLPLLVRVGRGVYRWNSDTRRFVRRTLRLETGPEQRLRSRLPRILARDYPAHLHMNVDAQLRGRRIGRRLVDRYCEDLRATQASGMHLFCGAAASGFYARLGFEELTRLEFRPGVWVYALGRRLTSDTQT